MPTLAGFIAWAATAMGVTETQLPSNSVFWTYAYNVSVATTSLWLACIPVGVAGATLYELAVYSLAGSLLLNWAQDPVGAPIYKDGLTFFAWMRSAAGYNINAWTPGVVTESHDETTGASLEVIEALANLTLGQLQNLKDPFGRTYLGLSQSLGSLWGIS